jgi:hypothetical protein
MNSEEYYMISLALHNSISADLINSLLCCLSETLDKLRVDVSQAIFDPVDELLDIFGMHTFCVDHPLQGSPKDLYWSLFWQIFRVVNLLHEMDAFFARHHLYFARLRVSVLRLSRSI